MLHSRSILLVSLLGICTGCTIQSGGQTVEIPPLVAIENVNLIPMDRERIVHGQTVVVRDGRIAAIGPAGSVDTEGARRVDGNGRYLIPGLADMHVHFMGGNQAINQDLLALYLANGVTTVLSLNGHPSHLELGGRIERGELLGPRLFSSGPSLRGNPPSSYEDGVQAVSRQKAGHPANGEVAGLFGFPSPPLLPRFAR